MKICVIVTTYNRPDALKKVMEGLMNQIFLPDEIIIADDGSDDNTKNMLKPYIQKKNIKHVWHEDKGFRAARIRNLAISKSNSEYLVLLDGDCIPEKRFVADHKQLAQKGYFFQGKRVIVSKNIEKKINYAQFNSLKYLMIKALKNEISNWHHMFRTPFFSSYTLKKLSGVRSCNMGVFKSDVLFINGFNNEFEGWGREDSEFVVRLYKYGLKRKENPFKAICYHLWHKENTRDFLNYNNELLDWAIKSDNFYCKSGIKELIGKNN